VSLSVIQMQRQPYAPVLIRWTEVKIKVEMNEFYCLNFSAQPDDSILLSRNM